MTMIETTPEGYEPIDRVKFTQRERRGVFLGRSTSQLVVAGAALLIVLILMVVFSAERVWPFMIVSAGIMSFALWNWRGESLLRICGRSISFMSRAAKGETKFRRDVWWKAVATTVPDGQAGELVPIPVVFKHETLPGGLGDVSYVDIPTKGGFVLNAKDRLAAVTIRVKSAAWMLRDEGRKEAAYWGLATWMSQLESIPGMVEAALTVRVDRAPTTELADYVEARDQVRDIEISDRLKLEYAALITQESTRAMDFSNSIRMVFDLEKLSKDIKDSGGGLVGIGAILADHVDSLPEAVSDLDVEFDKWLDAEELHGLTTAALDPVSTQERLQRFGRSRRELRSRSPIMSGEEHADHVEFDRSKHQTLWIHEWPRVKVRTGFMEPLLYRGEGTRCVTLIFRPVPLHEAINELSNAQLDMDTATTLREKWGGRTSVLHKREAQDLEEREEDLADGFTDERFRGFVTISGETLAEVRRCRTSLEQAGHGVGIRMSLLRNQQWPALVTATLPVPTKAKK